MTTTIDAQYASDNWKVYHNDKLIIDTGKPDEAKHLITFNKADLNKEGEFKIIFTEGSPQKDIKRTYSLVDEKDKEIISIYGFKMLKMSNEQLRMRFSLDKKIKIYSWYLPQDAQPGTIKSKRIHLCTIELK